MLAISSGIVFTPYPRSLGTSSGTNLKSFFNYVLEKEKVGKGLKENGKWGDLGSDKLLHKSCFKLLAQ
jgi:hypothetical protein